MPRLACSNEVAAARYEAAAADMVWGAYVDADCIVEGRFKFASFEHPEDIATVKIDAEALYREGNERQLGIVLGAVAGHPCIQAADILTYVPKGQKKFTHLLGGLTDKDVVDVERSPRSKSRYDFRFATEEGKEQAQSAQRPVICEDIVSTLGSVAGVRGLFLPDQDVHSVAQLLRGEVNPDYQEGLADHYLSRQDMALKITAAEVHDRFGFWPVSQRNNRVVSI